MNTKWECKYHIVFAPKHRRQIIYKQLKEDIEKILRELYEKKGIEIIIAECCPDHIHMFGKYFIKTKRISLKEKSALIIFKRHTNLKYKYINRHFRHRGYYVNTVKKNTQKIREYINS